MRCLRITVIAAVFGAACSSDGPALRSTEGFAQGTTYGVQWWSAAEIDDDGFVAAIEAELERIDALLSNYRADSAIEQFNRTRTTDPVDLPREIVDLLRIALDVHRSSAGCFEPTVRPLVTLWGLDGDSPRVPDAAALAATLEHVGLGKLELVDADTVRKTVPDLELDFSSIGQGYTVARLAETARSFGVEHYLVELGGEIAAQGHKPGGEPWRIGIEQPLATNSSNPIRRRLTLPTDRPSSVITSGTYRHFFEADGRRYSHILDPRTGSPVTHDLVAVTVVHESATYAAAWATALLCMGREDALAVAEREHLAALLYTTDGETVAETLTPALERDWPGILD